MRILIVFIFATLMSLPVFSQRDETVLKNPGLKFTGIWGGNTSRIHNFSGDGYYAHGGFFTFEFNKNFLIGWDGYTVNAENDQLGDIKSSTNGLLLGYAYSGYKVVHPVAYLSIGNAKSRAQGYESEYSFASHASVGAEFNVFRWFRIGGELGYRYIDDKGINWMEEANLSSPYVGIKFKFGWSWGR